jgi:hypothetical protein
MPDFDSPYKLLTGLWADCEYIDRKFKPDTRGRKSNNIAMQGSQKQQLDTTTCRARSAVRVWVRAQFDLDWKYQKNGGKCGKRLATIEFRPAIGYFDRVKLWPK